MWAVGGEDRWSPCRLHMCADTGSGAGAGPRRMAWRPIACARSPCRFIRSPFAVSPFHWAGPVGRHGQGPHLSLSHGTREPERRACWPVAVVHRQTRSRSSRDFPLAARRLRCVACRDRACPPAVRLFGARSVVFPAPPAHRGRAFPCRLDLCRLSGSSTVGVPCARGWAHPTRRSAHNHTSSSKRSGRWKRPAHHQGGWEPRAAGPARLLLAIAVTGPQSPSPSGLGHRCRSAVDRVVLASCHGAPQHPA